MKKNMIKAILFAALISMLLACDGDIDEISMNLELSTAVSGAAVSRNTTFSSGDEDTKFMLGELYADIATGTAVKDDTINNGIKLTCTDGGTVIFTIRCTNIERPVVTNQYNDVLREELRRWIEGQRKQGGSWTDKQEYWTVRRELL